MNNLRHNLITGFIIIIIAIIFLLGVWQLTAPAGPKPTASQLKLSPNDWVKGNKKAPAILIEYSDFQCPACAAYQPIVKKIAETYRDKIAFVYRHFPLPQHQNAGKAAFAAEAAGRQGKFWEMHDLIFTKQKDWSEHKKAAELFREYAQSLKLNLKQYDADIKSVAIKAKVESDLRSGAKADIKGTPTFFLNGEILDNPGSFEEFKKAIDANLKEKQISS